MAEKKSRKGARANHGRGDPSQRANNDDDDDDGDDVYIFPSPDQPFRRSAAVPLLRVCSTFQHCFDKMNASFGGM
eukprot:NODE_3465_length_783_cov_1.494505.p7 GENE.NODE_3465_length_783_cov_1.494505~~NODE_3465_length_783_cov_1.494505.p7  ORF type:complete len:75 (-),score=2.57 NODE_3465_length_783_cov_1.494505:179-403(-)